MFPPGIDLVWSAAIITVIITESNVCDVIVINIVFIAEIIQVYSSVKH